MEINMKTTITICLLAIGIMAKAQQTQPTYVIIQKDAAKAFIQSLAVPGLGQMYNEQVMLGLSVFAVETSFIGLGVITANNPKLTESTSVTLFTIAGIIHLAQLIHAPIVSNRINERNKTKSNFNKWTFAPTPTNVYLAYRF